MSDIAYSPPLRIAEIKSADGGGMEVAGYVSTFGNMDHGGDVVMRGAFDGTLERKSPVRFLFAHDSHQVLGRPIELRADDQGLFGRFAISQTSLGKDVHTLLKDGALDSFSMGYVPTDVEYDDGGARLLKSVDLLECSVVAMPMNERATVTAVKADTAEDKAVWNSAYVNSLPDSAFAAVYTDGDGNKQRKLPHHAKGGAVDLPHLRNALSREPQADMPSEQHGKAKAHLARHSRAEGIGSSGGKKLYELTEDFDAHTQIEELVELNWWYLTLASEVADLLRTAQRPFSHDENEVIDASLACAERGIETLERARAPRTDGLKLRLELARRVEAFRRRETTAHA